MPPTARNRQKTDFYKPPDKQSPAKKKPARPTQNPNYVKTKQKWWAMQITDWRLNQATKELEWEVLWSNDEWSWEPNSFFAKHRQLVWAFLIGGTHPAGILPTVV
eukprot:1458127-Rhodomonas_salina.1